MSEPYEVLCPSSDRERWLEMRRTGIGASESPILILGSLYGRTPFTLFAEKLGLGEPVVETEAMRLGHRLEAVSRELWNEEEDDGALEAEEWGQCLRSTLDPFMIATPDSKVIEWGAVGLLHGVLQHKTSGTLKAWEDGVPEHVRIQVQHELYVTGLRNGYASILAGGPQGMAFRWAKVKRDDAFINDVLIPTCARFWEMVQTKTPPEPDGSDESYRSALRLRKPVAGEVTALDGEWVDRDARLQELVGQQKALAYEEKEIRAKLALAMGTASEAVLPNGVRWKRSVVQRKGYVVEAGESVQMRRYEA